MESLFTAKKLCKIPTAFGKNVTGGRVNPVSNFTNSNLWSTPGSVLEKRLLGGSSNNSVSRIYWNPFPVVEPKRTFARMQAAKKDVGHMTWMSLLESTRVSQIVAKTRPIISAKETDRVSTVVSRLAEANVHGAVVLNEDDHPVGFIDVLDILTDVLEEANIQTKDIKKEDVIRLINQGHHFAFQTCGGLINISKRDPFLKITLNAFLIEAVRAMTNVHHVAVVTSKDNLINVMSQIDIVNFVLSHHYDAESRLSLPLLEAGLLPDNVVGALPDDVNVLGAMRYMRDCAISGVAIVNDEGRIITNFSATDLLGLTEDKFHLLVLPVKEFLRSLHGQITPPVCAKLHETPEMVMLKMNQHHVHRVYIVDDQMRPVGFLSLTDVMRFLGGLTI